MVNHNTDTIPVSGDNVFTVIVAAGSGTRFGSQVPKQFLDLSGIPVLMRTIEAFRQTLPEAVVVPVLSADGMEMWSAICEHYGYQSPAVVAGGASRSESVSNAVRHIRDNYSVDSDTVVMIHDGARPLVAPDMIRAILSRTRDAGVKAVVPVLPLTDAIAARTEGDGSVLPVDRASFCAVQTPQSFRLLGLAEAYRRAGDAVMPDDAAIMAEYGDAPIMTVPGHPQNIKITNPNDLEIAEIFLRNPVPYQV
ncbi:MAG: 2-C-methyl-D-erythritol 4-phosphate cytidylyltransferase [Muribaculaceae bacterium]|nr:2-C-methyl-D-erythritol 4-phosphate cytidylyltransferase [Muribaculaceae bacterium]